MLTAYEHNAIVRPLEYLQRAKGVEFSVVQPNTNGEISVESIEKACAPNTKLIISTYMANINGAVLPISDIGRLAKTLRCSFFVDAAQAAGLLEIDVEANFVDFLIFTGHKYLLGPSGIGGGYIRSPALLDEYLHGGSKYGSSLSSYHPSLPPYKFEAGTSNYLGIAALGAALNFPYTNYRQHIANLAKSFFDEISTWKKMNLYTRKEDVKAIISFTIDGLFAGEVAHYLMSEHNILVRSGFMCAPYIHPVFKTTLHGIVRVSFGYNNTYEQVEQVLKVLFNFGR